MYFNYSHALFTWASGSDREGNLIMRHDINKLIDWLIEGSFDSGFLRDRVTDFSQTQAWEMTIKLV